MDGRFVRSYAYTTHDAICFHPKAVKPQEKEAF
jgi:hypothetical protein